MMYRYQEWEDGVHNFDDHIILSLHLCLIFRNALQVTTCHPELYCACATVLKVLYYAEVYSKEDESSLKGTPVNIDSIMLYNIEHSCRTAMTLK